MKNILILTSGYCGKATANGICAKFLAEQLEKESVSVYVISTDFEDVKETGSDKVKSLYTPKVVKTAKKRSKIYYAIRLLKNMMFHSRTVQYDKNTVKRIVAEAQKVFQNVAIDAVVCMYFPLEAVIAGAELKKIHRDTNLVIFELDSVVDGIAGGGRHNQYMLNASKRTMKKLYQQCDIAMILNCHKSYWVKDFSEHSDKMRVTDLPLLTLSGLKHLNNDSVDKVSFLYAGNLDNAYRSPNSLIETFKSIKVFDWTIDFYSKGCEKELSDFSVCNGNVRVNGYVEQKVLNSKIELSDVLLSIGNNVSNSLPSKIITYMTYGKPIIHFCLQQNDICKQYLRKYPLSLIIEKDEDPASSADRVIDFVERHKGEYVHFDEICSLFPENLPSYSADIILDHINNKENNHREKKG